LLLINAAAFVTLVSATMCYQVTEGLQHHVKQKLSAVLAKFNGASFIEGEGGIKDVDVKLM
jgi:hypothetical protein